MRQTNLAIDGTTLWCDLMETAVFGGTPRGGIRRLALSDEDFCHPGLVSVHMHGPWVSRHP